MEALISQTLEMTCSKALAKWEASPLVVVASPLTVQKSSLKKNLDKAFPAIKKVITNNKVIINNNIRGNKDKEIPLIT